MFTGRQLLKGYLIMDIDDTALLLNLDRNTDYHK